MEEWSEGCADDDGEEGEDYEGQIADEDSKLVGKETEVGFCGCWGLGCNSTMA